ncbi:hypothetical protein PRK78_006260 [Emydomyces testavorans]|uniref:Uncharacterized protein n=1 Tax=Emydomyces testavorans TaxID=2070801 RepID=A0AAF0DN67_9EURO|nr:hypothetical protein PRK78_006260 [Emydomyces testavorans]
MSDYPTSNTPVTTAGFTEFCEVNGRQFKRKKGTQQWTEVSKGGVAEDTVTPFAQLSLVHQKQADGEPLHWSLFVARENEEGMVYQVKGDAECMNYKPSPYPINVVKSASFLNAYNLASLTEQQAMIVKEVAEREPPPSAVNRQAVVENCQGWTVRVIAKLVDRGIVQSAKLQMAKSMVERI